MTIIDKEVCEACQGIGCSVKRAYQAKKGMSIVYDLKKDCAHCEGTGFQNRCFRR